MSQLEARVSRRRHFFQSLGRHLAIIALFAQLMAPTARAAHPSLDIAGLLCMPLGTLSEEALAEAQTVLSALPGEKQEDKRNSPHCPFCVLVHGVPLPEHQLTLFVVFEPHDVASPRFETPFVYRPQGPPLGLRAPPPVSL